MNPSFSLRSSLTFAATLSIASFAPAANILWNNAGTGDWDDPANWAGGALPAATNTTTDVAQINNGGTASVDSTQTVSAGAVTLGTAAGGSGTIQISGGSLTSLGTVAAGASTGATGNLQVTGGNLTINTSDLRIGGNGTNGTGTMTMTSGSVTMNAGNLNVGFGPASASTASGTINLSGNGSILVQNPTAIMAVGNRGTGTINQTGGSVELRSPNSVVNLGRNNATLAAAGTYSLSNGSLTAARLQYGNNNTAGFNAGTKDFNLSGTGVFTTGIIFALSTASTNQFNFTGGSLSVGGAFTAGTGISGNINIPLTNNGGTLAPADNTFSAAGVATDHTGTLTFGDGFSYTQNSGTLAIDIDGAGSNDLITLGIGAPVGNAAIGGIIAITMLSGYDPVPGSFFDVVAADSITNTATLTGTTVSGFAFAASEVIGGDGREVLRLTVVPEPAGILLFAAAVPGFLARRRR